MNEEQKKKYWERYLHLKHKGVKFYPDVVYKDIVVIFGLLLLLVGLATFLGVHPEPRVDPNDTTYIPRPEWYFLFLFQFLKYVPPQLEWVGAIVVPSIAVLVLLLLPFIEKNPYRHWSRRKIATGTMTLIVIAMVGLTVQAVVTTPPQEEKVTALSLPAQIQKGQDLFSTYCAECHGPDGGGGIVQGVEGLNGKYIKPINSKDEMYTRTDQTLFNIINYGQPDLGMVPFGKAYGGELSPDQIKAIVTFMRYTWDDRAQLPPEAKHAAAKPTLAPNQVPSYDDYIEPIVKHYCVSCHRPGKKNNHYLMTSYDEVLHTGDHAPVIVPGDPNSLLLQLIRRQKVEGIDPMPPTKPLPDDAVDLFTRWILGGAPKTAEDAAKATLPANAGATPTPSP